MKHRKIYLRISELSELSGVPVKAIRVYLSKGILPQPIIAGKRLRYYTRQHLKRLRLIKEMENEGIPVSILEGMITSVNETNLESQSDSFQSSQQMRGGINNSSFILKKMMVSVDEIEGKSQIEKTDISKMIRNEILNSSIRIFRKKGYESVTISDIAKASKIGRNTFYKYFHYESKSS